MGGACVGVRARMGQLTRCLATLLQIIFENLFANYGLDVTTAEGTELCFLVQDDIGCADFPFLCDNPDGVCE